MGSLDRANRQDLQRAHATRLETVRQRLKAVQKETGDPWVMKWDYE